MGITKKMQLEEAEREEYFDDLFNNAQPEDWEMIEAARVIPFQTDDKGRKYLTDQQVYGDPQIERFVQSYPAHFKRDDNLGVVYFTYNPSANPDA